jgi:hypothetical protein
VCFETRSSEEPHDLAFDELGEHPHWNTADPAREVASDIIADLLHQCFPRYDWQPSVPSCVVSYGEPWGGDTPEPPPRYFDGTIIYSADPVRFITEALENERPHPTPDPP